MHGSLIINQTTNLITFCMKAKTSAHLKKNWLNKSKVTSYSQMCLRFYLFKVTACNQRRYQFITEPHFNTFSREIAL